MMHTVLRFVAFVTSALLLETSLQIMFKARGELDLYRKPLLVAMVEGRLFKKGLFVRKPGCMSTSLMEQLYASSLMQ